MLLAAGADPSAKDAHGNTPLSSAKNAEGKGIADKDLVSTILTAITNWQLAM
jgi:ankyrin repeat protein